MAKYNFKGLCEQDSMDMTESKVHSFIIKLWVEDDDETGQAIWHGYITHVPDDARHYLKDRGDILDFVASYVGEMKTGATQNSRIRKWLWHIVGKRF